MNSGRVSLDLINELTESEKFFGLTYKVENWPQKWGAQSLIPGTPLHRDVLWLINLRNAMVHPRENWIALRDADKKNLQAIPRILEEVIRHWQFSLPAALPKWLTRQCIVKFEQ
jgi:hypothetical protein